MKDKVFDYLLIALILIGIFVFSTISQNANADIPNGSAKLYFLDVGQGDSALISLPGDKQILIDTGRSADISSKVKSKMPAFDNKIEKIILSHPDSDHTGGMPAILDNFKVDDVYINTDKSDSKLFATIEDKIKLKSIRQTIVSQGDNIYEGDLKIHILWPEANSSLSENNRSIVMRAEIGPSKALFSGDVELEGQQKILSSVKSEDLVADLYKVPHHGSGGAWNESFAKAIKAKNAVISVGENSYGHPASLVTEGIAKLGYKLYRTDQTGTLEFVPTEEGWSLAK